MNKLVALLAAGAFAVSSAAIAQTAAPAAKAADKAAAAPMKLEKPAAVAQADWDKMTEAQKKEAIEKAKKAASSSAPAPKVKKGGC